jgi:mono/diheme cytochrome c family protein
MRLSAWSGAILGCSLAITSAPARATETAPGAVAKPAKKPAKPPSKKAKPAQTKPAQAKGTAAPAAIATAPEAGKPAAAPVKAAEPAKVAPGAKYTLVAVPAPDKKAERLWKSKCGSCHGADGKGGEAARGDLSAAAWQTGQSDEDLRARIRKGVSTTKDGVTLEMKAFEDSLTPEQVEGLVSYVRWLGAPK